MGFYLKAVFHMAALVIKTLIFVYLLLNVCHSSSITQLETVFRLLNDCARFYPQADLNMAENLIVSLEVAVNSVQRLQLIHWTEVPRKNIAS